ncbi:MAG: prepilin-type N-terminal cleavage/methylation domain-containing protein [Patescibacteria group bacterium]|jgi:prepilin-type N-terminal cleavage/methylation domain-containing protein/uncharacterized protein (TIGR02145 family)
MFKPKKAFTLIELLVVIAIIGVLATVSIIALSNARSKSRDAKRVGNMKQVQTALELFFNDNGRYPTVEEWDLGTLYSTTSDATTTYMRVIPTAPTPADGDCSEGENELAYTSVDNGAFAHIGINTKFWSSSEANSTASWSCAMYYSNTTIDFDGNDKPVGLSVRCLQDQP